MAARKNTPKLPPAWRDRIKTSMLINRLESFVNGKVEMEPAQVTAALGLLRKTLPDLSSTALTDPEGKKLPPPNYTININGVEKK